MNTSPSKRRALASLDANASASPRTSKIGKPATATASPAIARLNLSAGQLSEQKKRPSISTMEEPPAKKACLEPSKEGDEGVDENDCSFKSERQRSLSPAVSSVFDTSTNDISQATNLTEPDQAAAVTATAPIVAPRPRPLATREESRRRVDTLRLRLRLADYKVRTGQTDVPFEELHARPLPGTHPARIQPPRRTPLPSAPSRGLAAIQAALQSQRLMPPRTVSLDSGVARARTIDERIERRQEDEEDSDDGEDIIPSRAHGLPGPLMRAGANLAFLSPQKLPQLVGRSAALTPRRPHLDEDAEERLTSSALRGGAANGLLRLSLGRL